MKFGLNQATLKTAPLEEFLQAAGEAKFDGVEVCQENVAQYLDRGSYSALKDILESYPLTVAAVNALDDFNLCSDFDFKTKLLSQWQFMAEIGYKLESDLLIVTPSFLREDANPADVREDKIISRTQKRLAELSKIAGSQDLKVGFEFVGFPGASVRTLALTRKIVDPLIRRLENVGFVVDTFHFLISEGNLHDLTGISQLFMIHVSDLSFTPGEKFSRKKDPDRVFPGEGNFDFTSFFTALKTIKHQGYISIKLVNPALPEQPVMEVAKKARDSLSMIKFQ